jgi:peptidylprolyl isomerase/peptidyl-prolyl cis-trans isomerase D
MAVLSKIRQRSVFLIIIIALALFSFVLSGIFSSNSPLFNKNVTDIGSVNDEPISREEFAQQVEYFRNNSNRNISQMQQVNSAWNNLVREKIYKTQLEKSGIVVGEQDVWNAIVNQFKAQNNPMFQNELGMFDEEKLKEYIANLKDSANDSDQAKAAWVSWVNYEKNIKSNLEQNTYNSLIRSGLNSTLKDGERKYFYENNNVDMKYVYVPFNSISDSLVKVSEEEIKQYIKDHAKDFEAEASRDIEFVNFEIKPSKEDELEIKNELASLINDKEEYSAAAKNTVKVTGFANATDMKDFFVTNDSDTPFDNSFYTKKALPKILADSLFDKNIGEVFGPYKDKGYYKLSKIIAVKQLPDSVKASHILISYKGSDVRDPSLTMTQDEAKKVADSLLNVIKADKSKFESIAKEMSVDKMSGAKGGDLGWFVYRSMVPEFRDFVFENKTGDIDVVKTQFGYHIIRIDGQKNKQKNVQIATFSRKIEPSEKTENEIFQEAETFASEVSSGKDFKALAKEKNYVIIPVQNLKELDENISVLGPQRQIVRWLFDKNTIENDVKRFDTDKGYAIVKLIKKHKKGLSDRMGIVRNILMNRKKAELIAKRSTGDNLEEIAKQNNTAVKTARAVSNASPVLSGEGRFPEIIGVVTTLEENKLAKNIEGARGVAFAIVTKKHEATALGNYQANKTAQERKLKSRNIQIYNAIKDNSEIEDNRAVFY